MSVRIEWAPSTETDIASYLVNRAVIPTGPWTLIATITYNLLGANYDAGRGVFFYVDTGGTASSYYQLIAVDTSANQSVPSQAFQPTSSAPAITNLVRVDEDYGQTNALRYQTNGGVPVENAIIRVFTKTNFDLGNTNQPLAVTRTNATGGWVDPIFLTAGFTYVVEFAKQGYAGPDHVEIVV